MRQLCIFFTTVFVLAFFTSNFPGVNSIETIKSHEDENLAHTWTKRAQQTLSDRVVISNIPVPDKAKSAILAVGAGMSVETVTASRLVQNREVEQENPLYFDIFPVLGMAKTYCVDAQVGDAACTATAYLSGIKSNSGIVGAGPVGSTTRCGITDELDKLRFGSIAEWAIAAGKSVGIVTTSRVTHPGVAGSYGRSTKATWENDDDVMKDGHDPTECPDLAIQLLQNDPGNKFKVILGGGRQHFLPNTTLGGKRLDNNNLITDWMNERINMKQKHKYVGSKNDLMSVDLSVEYLLGLFALGDLSYHNQAPPDQPSIEDMTEAAIRVLSKNENGFFLFIFGGRIADAHNENKGIIALDETIELSKAIKKASIMTEKDETLVVVTANHAHTMKMAGYGSRWDSFYEVITNEKDKVDDYKYLSLNYANGPGYRPHVDGHRPIIQDEPEFKEKNPNFRFLAQFPLDLGTGGGDDVAIYARGPSQHLFHGVMEQHLIPHLMAYSLCVGQGVTACDNETIEPVISEKGSAAMKISSTVLSVTLPWLLSFIICK